MSARALARHGFWWVYGCAAVLSLACLWTVKYLPMTDLAQHAAQVSIARNLHDPAFGFEGYFELHWFTPYAFGTALALLFSSFFGVLTSLKIVLSLAVLAFPLSLRSLLRETDGDPWWALSGFLAFFGFSFYWGFFSYLVALPLGVWFVTQALRHRREPTWPSAIRLLCLGLLVFFSHGIAFVIVAAAAGALLLLEVGTRRELAPRIWPLLAPLSFFLAWLATESHQGRRLSFPIDWGPASAIRWSTLPANLTGDWTDPSAMALGWLVLAALVVGMGLPRQPIRLVPLAVAVLFYDLVPAGCGGAFYIFERTAVFVLVFALAGFPASTSLLRRGVSRTALSLMVLLWLAVLSGSFHRFDVQARSYDAVMKDVPPRSRILALIFDKDWEANRETFAHFPAWQQTERGGVLGFSFAQFPVMVARYIPGKEPLPFWKALRISWDPARTNWDMFPVFDYYVVRSFADRGRLFEQKSAAPVRLVARRDEWWVYEVDRAGRKQPR
jgi:hypothetical protein